MIKNLIGTLLLTTISTIVVAKSINISTMEELNLNKKEIAEQEANKLQMQQKGYIETSTNTPKNYQSMLSKKKSLFSASNEQNPYGTDLKRNLVNIKLTFKFDGISFIPAQDVIGYAVSGTYKDGWTGIAEYFNVPVIGVCHYLVLHAEANEGEVYLRKDLVTHAVNGKISDGDVIGNKQDGFVYGVNWYTEKFWRTLECVNQKFDKDMQGKVIELAKKIDKDFK